MNQNKPEQNVFAFDDLTKKYCLTIIPAATFIIDISLFPNETRSIFRN